MNVMEEEHVINMDGTSFFLFFFFILFFLFFFSLSFSSSSSFFFLLFSLVLFNYNYSCTCSNGFQGADCSERICPYGIAWSDEATGIDIAHASSECSNRGICNRKNGRCLCMEGYTGAACERLKCQNDCNNFGHCLTLEKIAENTRFILIFIPSSSYFIFRDELSQSFVYEKIWDSDKIMACVCDVAHTGYDCSQWLCPNGDDPLTPDQVSIYFFL